MGSNARTKEEEVRIWQFRQDVHSEAKENDEYPLLIIIFATAGYLHHLKQTCCMIWRWHIKSLPQSILPTVHNTCRSAWTNNSLIYSLLPSKSKKCYRFLSVKLKELMVEKGMFSNVMEFRSDLEVASMKTFLPIFTPESVLTWFFHLAQAHWRKIQSLSSFVLYTSEEQYSLF